MPLNYWEADSGVHNACGGEVDAMRRCALSHITAKHTHTHIPAAPRADVPPLIIKYLFQKKAIHYLIGVFIESVFMSL